MIPPESSVEEPNDESVSVRRSSKVASYSKTKGRPDIFTSLRNRNTDSSAEVVITMRELSKSRTEALAPKARVSDDKDI